MRAGRPPPFVRIRTSQRSVGTCCRRKRRPAALLRSARIVNARLPVPSGTRALEVTRICTQVSSMQVSRAATWVTVRDAGYGPFACTVHHHEVLPL